MDLLDELPGTLRSPGSVTNLVRRLRLLGAAHPGDKAVRGALDAADWCLKGSNVRPLTGDPGRAVDDADDEAVAARSAAYTATPGVDPERAHGVMAWLDWWTCQAPLPPWMR